MAKKKKNGKSDDILDASWGDDSAIRKILSSDQANLKSFREHFVADGPIAQSFEKMVSAIGMGAAGSLHALAVESGAFLPTGGNPPARTIRDGHNRAAVQREANRRQVFEQWWREQQTQSEVTRGRDYGLFFGLSPVDPTMARKEFVDIAQAFVGSRQKLVVEPMRDDELSFWRAVAANPADDLPRLVYADWLEDHGSRWDHNAAFGRYVRWAVNAARGVDPPTPDGSNGVEHKAFGDKVVAALGLELRRGFTTLPLEYNGSSAIRDIPAVMLEWAWHRGFPCVVSFPSHYLQTFFGCSERFPAGRMPAVLPIEQLALTFGHGDGSNFMPGGWAVAPNHVRQTIHLPQQTAPGVRQVMRGLFPKAVQLVDLTYVTNGGLMRPAEARAAVVAAAMAENAAAFSAVSQLLHDDGGFHPGRVDFSAVAPHHDRVDCGCNGASLRMQREIDATPTQHRRPKPKIMPVIVAATGWATCGDVFVFRYGACPHCCCLYLTEPAALSELTRFTGPEGVYAAAGMTVGYKGPGLELYVDSDDAFALYPFAEVGNVMDFGRGRAAFQGTPHALAKPPGM